MTRTNILALAALAAVLSVTAALAWLTATDSDPCDRTPQDVGAAMLAGESEQEGMVNRAIVIRGACEHGDW